MTERSFEEARAEAVQTCLRLNELAGIMSADAYYPNRLNAAEKEEAVSAGEEHTQGIAGVRAFVKWGLEEHRDAMLQWADDAADSAPTEAAMEGWEDVRDAWGAGDVDPEEAEVSLAWLVAIWHRASS